DKVRTGCHEVTTGAPISRGTPRRLIHSDRMTKKTDPMRMQLPRARTLGRSCGNRSWLKINTGNVTWLPHKKAATRYSSNDALKHGSRLDRIPGHARGNVTPQNVCQGLSPRSELPPSRLRSKPSRREIMINRA